MKRRKRKRDGDCAEGVWRHLPDRVEQVLELPVGSLSSLARIELTGNRCVMVEGCCGIIEYTEDCVRLDIGSGEVRFNGRELTVSQLTQDSAVICGRFVSVEYL